MWFGVRLMQDAYYGVLGVHEQWESRGVIFGIQEQVVRAHRPQNLHHKLNLEPSTPQNHVFR